MLVKICGLCRAEDASRAVAAGATHVGVIRVPGAARTRPVGEALRVLDAGAGARRVGVFVDAGAGAVLEESTRLGLDVVQLHGSEAPAVVGAVRDEGLEVWKVVRPGSGAELRRAASRYAGADLLLVEGRSDQGHGGVGARFDWEALEAALLELEGVSVGVAGGLTPETVAEAVRRFRPSLVDVSSGVEARPGEKDEARVRAFVAAARAAALATHGGRG